MNYLFKITFASVSLFWCSWSNCISSLPISYHPIFLFHLVLFGSSPVNSPWLFSCYFPAHLLNCLKKKMSQKEIASSRFLFYSQATSSRDCGDLLLPTAISEPLKGTMLSQKRRIRQINYLSVFNYKPVSSLLDALCCSLHLGSLASRIFSCI